MSIGHIARSCCYVVPVALLNKELRRQYCDTINVEITCKLGGGPHLGICYGIAVWRPGSGRVAGALIGNFVLTLALLFLTLAP